MGSKKGFLAVISLLGFTIFIILTTRGLDLYQQKTAPISIIKQSPRKDVLKQHSAALRSTKQQRLRQDLLRRNCAAVNLSLEDLNSTYLNNFIVDDKHGIIYCYIPKVACTNWKRTLIALNSSKPYPDPMSFEQRWVHNFDRFKHLKNFPQAERKEKLQHYTKFLFVRDPFVRLISAYRDKMQHYDQYFYKGYYLLDPRTERYASFEPHWRQMHRLCHPCLVEYDFVGHQETLQEDAQELLKMLKLEDDIKFPPSYENMTSTDSVKDWFQSVPLEDRRKLYKVYEKDFQLFGYRRPTELLDE
ncbi:carbohydrate sulfotransferase 12 isoform X2 [Oryzias melastigma]|uniref:carbohydrate sulfotransferase 12 isoform X2 n=1 Tax=Oryzias melastigma TaxID=30732 RepID=UPI00168D56D1|nr:carbohydrate sulfotransferase 12 isoform X2 [Oryzias melastigma]